VYFTGDWYNANDSMIAAGKDAKVYLLYDAKVANIVAQGNDTLIVVSLDGRQGTFSGRTCRLQEAPPLRTSEWPGSTTS